MWTTEYEAGPEKKKLNMRYAHADHHPQLFECGVITHA